ncbi:MAG: M23 family metallopeptidase [Anaerolineales bacterium]|nr:MAG: M23 family metallopeptidase [Anaerolineales bacterium]
MAFRMLARVQRALTLTVVLACVLAPLSATGCNVASSLVAQFSPTATATLTPTVTATGTPTATPTPAPTSTPTPTIEPLQLSLNLHPPQVRQGHTLLVEVLANRPVTVTGALDDRTLSFTPGPGGAWAVAGMPVTAEVAAHPVQLSVVDSWGGGISTTMSVMVMAADFGSEQIELPADRVYLLEPEVVREEAQQLGQVFAHVTPQPFWSSTFIWPHAEEVTSPFGIRRTYNNGQNSYHGGIDISAEAGAPVAASSDGRVALAEPLQVRGNAVILDHGLGVYSGYYHLSEILVAEGQQVAQGDVIGHAGNTGLSTGVHLHWEMRVGGVLVNPLEWTFRQFPQ